MSNGHTIRQDAKGRAGEAGYMLAALMFAVAMVMITLAIAAPKVARELQRERELESVHRAKQYVRAIQLYYRKFGSYPTSIDQLVSTNNIRFLRQRYADPLTGKADWRLIHLGQNKTQSEGFFGKPLSGVGTVGGGLAGATNAGSVGTNTASTFFTDSSDTSGTNAGSGAPGSNGINNAGTGTSANGANGVTTPGPGMTSQTASTFAGGGGGPIIGVSSVKEGESIIVIHQKDHYKDWEFFYDPRAEQMQAMNAAMAGGGNAGSNPASNMGNSSASGFNINNPTSNSGNPTGSSGTGTGSGGTGTGSGGSSGNSGGGGAAGAQQQ